MAEEVVATLDWSGKSKAGPVTASRSVEGSAKCIVKQETTYGNAAVRLAKAFNVYGCHAQLWLSGVNKFTLGENADFKAMA